MTRFAKSLWIAAAIAVVAASQPASAASFLIDNVTGSANNRQSFDPSTDVWHLNTIAFPVNGPLVFASAAAGDPGLAGTVLDNPATFAPDANVIVIRNFDNNDTNGFPANWDNSFNARRSLEAIAANTEGNRPGFYLYWNEGLGVNRLVHTSNLNDGAASLRVLFAINSDNLISNSDNLSVNTALRPEANANFNALAGFSAANFVAVPEPAAALLGGVALAGLAARRRAA